MFAFVFYLSLIGHWEPFLEGIFFLGVHGSKTYQETSTIRTLTHTGHTQGIQKPACGGNEGQVMSKVGLSRTSALPYSTYLPSFHICPPSGLVSTFYCETSLFYSRSSALPGIEGFLLHLLLSTLSCCLCPLSHSHTNQTYELQVPPEKNTTYRLASALSRLLTTMESQMLGCGVGTQSHL